MYRDLTEDVEKILLTEEQIRQRVSDIAKEIDRDL